MSVRTVLIVVLALVFGGMSAVLARNFIEIPVLTPPAPVETVDVVVLKGDIGSGAALTEDLVEVKQFPKAFVPLGALTSKKEADKRVTAGMLVAGDILTQTKLLPEGSAQGLAHQLPDDMRAYSITVQGLSATSAGFIQPGHLVDILATLSTTKGQVATTILQKVKVLAVSQRLDPSPTARSTEQEASSVTLLLSPYDCSLMDLAQSRGTLKLILRNPKDKNEIVARILTEEMLHPRPPEAEKEKEKPAPPMPESLPVSPIPEGKAVVEVKKDVPKPADWVLIIQEDSKIREIEFFNNKGKKVDKSPENP